MSAPRGVPAVLEWLVCHALPAEHRGRYHREFVAEMWWMTTFEQLRYAVRLLLAVRPLRAALRGQPATEVVPPLATSRCAHGTHHHWVTRSTDDGSRYRTCARCGLDRAGSAAGPDDWAWPSFTGPR